MKMINTKKIVSVVISLMLGITLLIGCGNKTEIVKNDFVTKMQDSGFKIVDATEQVEKGAVKSITLAMNDNYQIEFYEMNNEEDAANAYENNKNNIEKNKGTVSTNTSVEMGNHSKYTLNAQEKYYCISRVGKTFIYLVVPSEYKSEVSNYLDTLGY